EAPDQLAAMADAALAGDWDRARQIHYRLLPLMRVNFVETNPVPVKTALELMGRGAAHFRLPLCELSEAHHETLREALELAGIATTARASAAALAEAGS